MNTDKIQNTLNKISLKTYMVPVSITLGTCTKTGRPKVSVGLTAPDNRVTPGLPVKTDTKAGGIGGAWPPHTVVLDSDDEQHVVESVLTALDMASAHENREHLFFEGKLFRNPHAQE